MKLGGILDVSGAAITVPSSEELQVLPRSMSIHHLEIGHARTRLGIPGILKTCDSCTRSQHRPLGDFNVACIVSENDVVQVVSLQVPIIIGMHIVQSICTE